MKILFIYPNITGHENISLGLASLSSYLKKEGHETDLVDFTWGISIVDCINKVKKSKPDIIGFSVLSGEFLFSLQVARELKKNFHIPIIFGGVHPTVAPEETIRQEDVDMICIGEGELALAQLLNNMEKGEEIFHIANFWFKNNGTIIQNPVRPLIQDLDSLPYPDRELFNYSRYMEATSGTADVISGRGCPFSCTYCINHFLQKLYHEEKGKRFLRRHSVDYILGEISFLVQKYSVKHINFEDDLFTLDKKWLREFSEKYPRKFNIPFSCNARVETINEEVANLLKKANCVSVSMGIESGSERIRKKVLKRHMSNNQIINAFKWAKEAGLNTTSYNMLGIPFETRHDMEETIRLNQTVKPDFLASSIFLPYPGTELYYLCKERGWIQENTDIPSSHRVKSIMNYPHISAKEIEKWKKWFRFKVFIRYNILKAFTILPFDLGYGIFFKLRAKIPRNIKNIMFKVNNWLRYKTQQIRERRACRFQ